MASKRPTRARRVPEKKTQEAERSLDPLEAEYRATSNIAERFADEVCHQLEKLIADENIVLSFAIQRRVKAWPSLIEKLNRKSIVLKTIRDLPDLVGIRIVTQFQRDVNKICEIIARTLTVIERNDTHDRLKEDQFGYASVHFVVQLPSGWLTVPTFSGMSGFRAEIQVRTTPQHIWAAASHTLQYKNEASIPLPIRRAIHRVSALLETVDLEFERVLRERDAYRNDMPEDDATLNVDLLERVLSDVFPAENKDYYEDYARLLGELANAAVTKRNQLVTLLKKHLQAALKEENRRYLSVEESDFVYPDITTRERHKRGVFYTLCGLTRVALAEEFGSAWYMDR